MKATRSTGFRCAAVVLAVAVGSALADGCRAEPRPPTPRVVTAVGGAQDKQIARALLELVNTERAREGILKLTWDETLAKVARSYSRDMARRDYFSHVSPGGATLDDRLKSAGVGYVSVAENLGMNRGFSDPAADCVKGWLASPPHRRNMLSGKYRWAGVGVTRRADMTFFFTMIFRAHPDYGEGGARP